MDDPLSHVRKANKEGVNFNQFKEIVYACIEVTEVSRDLWSASHRHFPLRYFFRFGFWSLETYEHKCQLKNIQMLEKLHVQLSFNGR